MFSLSLKEFPCAINYRYCRCVKWITSNAKCFLVFSNKIYRSFLDAHLNIKKKKTFERLTSLKTNKRDGLYCVLKRKGRPDRPSGITNTRHSALEGRISNCDSHHWFRLFGDDDDRRFWPSDAIINFYLVCNFSGGHYSFTVGASGKRPIRLYSHSLNNVIPVIHISWMASAVQRVCGSFTAPVVPIEKRHTEGKPSNGISCRAYVCSFFPHRNHLPRYFAMYYAGRPVNHTIQWPMRVYIL